MSDYPHFPISTLTLCSPVGVPSRSWIGWRTHYCFFNFFFLFLSFSKIMLKWTLSISCVRSSLYLFTPKSWNFPVFAGLIKLYKTTISDMAFFSCFPDCLFYGSIPFSTVGRVEGKIHLQHYTIPCHS